MMNVHFVILIILIIMNLLVWNIIGVTSKIVSHLIEYLIIKQCIRLLALLKLVIQRLVMLSKGLVWTRYNADAQGF